MLYIILLSIFLVPMASMITIKDTIVWYPQLLALQFIGGLCFASRFWNINRFLAIFIAYLTFSYVYVTGASPRTLLCLMIGFAAVSVTLVVSKLEKKDLKWIYYALTIMSLLNILYAISQHLGFDPIFKAIGGGKEDVVGLMGSHNQLGIYSVANAFWFPICIPLAIIPIFFAKCNSALIGLFFGGTLYIYFNYGKKITLTIFTMALLLLIPWWHFCHKGMPELNERFSIWKLSFHQLVDGKIEDSLLDGSRREATTSPLIGFGLGNFFVYSPMSQYKMYGFDHTEQYQGGDPKGKVQHFYEHEHNDLLEALYEFGYVGFAIVLLCILSVVLVFIQCTNKNVWVVLTFSSLLAQSISSLSVYVFHAPVSLFMFCLTLGLFYAEVNNAKPSQIAKNTA